MVLLDSESQVLTAVFFICFRVYQIFLKVKKSNKKVLDLVLTKFILFVRFKI